MIDDVVAVFTNTTAANWGLILGIIVTAAILFWRYVVGRPPSRHRANGDSGDGGSDGDSGGVGWFWSSDSDGHGGGHGSDSGGDSGGGGDGGGSC